MADLSRGTRTRRGVRRPGWLLLTVLLVLAIGASSALVFTSRVELLKLAVILALWAAVVAAFVSVIYRRQSDIDQAKVRDLKLVYDLQLDREISARREYELTVETQLRRELTSEIRDQAADEVAGLRAELAALRANLEYLFDADLSHRPAIETDRSRAYSDWPGAESAGRVTASRIDTEDREDVEANTEESPIIDVPAEPHPPEPDWVAQTYGGAHRRPSETEQEGRRHRVEEPPPAWSPPPPQPPPAPVMRPTPEPPFNWQRPQQERPPAPPPEPPRSAEWQPVPAEGEWIPAGAPGSNWVSPDGPESSAQPTGPDLSAQPTGPDLSAQPTGPDLSAQPTGPDLSAQPTGENGFAGGYVGRRRAEQPAPPAAAAGEPPEPAPAEPPAPEPAAAEPPEPAPAEQPAPEPAAAEPAEPAAAEAAEPAEPAPAEPPEPAPAESPEPAMQSPAAESRRGKHSAPPDATDPGRPPAQPALAAESAGPPPHPEPEPTLEPSPEQAEERRHRRMEDTGGQSVADLLARLQTSPSGGARRRRRDE